MGVDLRNELGEKFFINNTGWRYLLEFARARGFAWPMDQAGDEAEALTSTQSAALASAIEVGIGDGRAEEVAIRVSEELTRRLVTPSTSPIFRQEPIALPAKTIDYWREFARFARRGGFAIES